MQSVGLSVFEAQQLRVGSLVTHILVVGLAAPTLASADGNGAASWSEWLVVSLMIELRQDEPIDEKIRSKGAVGVRDGVPADGRGTARFDSAE